MKRDLASMFSGAVMPGDEASTFVRRQLTTGEPQLPQYDPHGGWDTFKNAGYMGASMAPGGGIADAAGQLGGPSLAQNLRDKNYGSAAMQGLGAAADFAGPAGAVGKGLAGLMAGAVKAAAGSKAVPAMIIGGRALERAFPGKQTIAERLELEGKSPQSILDATGLHKGVDVSRVDPSNPQASGPWRGEISDHKMRIKVDPSGSDAQRGMKLSDFVQHDQLFDAVPELRNMDIMYNPNATAGMAAFAEPGIYDQFPSGGIYYGPGALGDDFRYNLGHEINHASDFATGLPAGGNPGLISNPHMQSALFDEMVKHPPNSPTRRLYEALRLNGNPSQPDYAQRAEQKYYLHGGEQNAYATEARLDLHPDQRRKLSILDPEVGYPNPVDQHIPVPQGLWRRLFEQVQGGPIVPSTKRPGE